MNNLIYRIGGYGISLWHDANHVNVINNTVFNNDLGGVLVGGGDYVHTAGPADYVYVANNLVYDNPGTGIMETGETGSHNTYTNNLVALNGINWVLLTSTHTNTVVASNPRFVNYIRAGGGDYHLSADSPAIDAGTAGRAPPTDLDGVARPQGAGYDIGAYEFVNSRRRE
jgi:hypothetical protein